MLFKRRTLEEENKRLADREERGTLTKRLKQDYTTFKEKQAQRSVVAREYRKGLSSQKDVEKDFKKLSRGAVPALSGGALYGRMARRR